jgi:hypothetical protein
MNTCDSGRKVASWPMGNLVTNPAMHSTLDKMKDNMLGGRADIVAIM